MPPRKSRLGRGLDSLVPPGSVIAAPAVPAPPTADISIKPGSIKFIPIGQIQPNPLQPRSDIDPTSLAGLVDSLRMALETRFCKAMIATERRVQAATARVVEPTERTSYGVCQEQWWGASFRGHAA